MFRILSGNPINLSQQYARYLRPGSGAGWATYHLPSTVPSCRKSKPPAAKGRLSWKNLARSTPLILFRDRSASLPLPLSRRIAVNLAIFGKFRWGRWRRPGAPFSSCRQGLQTEPSREEWGLQVPRVLGAPAHLIPPIVVGKS